MHIHVRQLVARPTEGHNNRQIIVEQSPWQSQLVRDALGRSSNRSSYAGTDMCVAPCEG